MFLILVGCRTAAGTSLISIPLQLDSTSVKTTQVAAYAHSHCLNSLGCGNLIICNSVHNTVQFLPHPLSTSIYFSNKITLNEVGDNIKHAISRVSAACEINWYTAWHVQCYCCDTNFIAKRPCCGHRQEADTWLQQPCSALVRSQAGQPPALYHSPMYRQMPHQQSALWQESWQEPAVKLKAGLGLSSSPQHPNQRWMEKGSSILQTTKRQPHVLLLQAPSLSHHTAFTKTKGPSVTPCFSFLLYQSLLQHLQPASTCVPLFLLN